MCLCVPVFDGKTDGRNSRLGALPNWLQESADPGTSTSHASLAPLLSSFSVCFFFSLPASLSIHLSHLRLHLAFLLLVIDLLVILSPSSLGYFRFPFALSLPSYLSIFTRHPPPLLFSLPLPPCLWLSSSDRLLMQAVYESISPSAVVELAPLLSRQDLFISLPTSA